MDGNELQIWQLYIVRTLLVKKAGLVLKHFAGNVCLYAKLRYLELYFCQCLMQFIRQYPLVPRMCVY